VTPTPAAIDAAVNGTPAVTPTATTGAQPLYAATHPVAGAYPLTYVDYLYAPAHGLSVQKTEALATVIRYLATDGQHPLAGNGDGQLSSTLVSQALASANQLVISNCPAADLVDTATPGPYTPTGLPGLDGLGKAFHCEVPGPSPPATTTTVVTGGRTTTTSVASNTPSTTASAATGGSGVSGGFGSSSGSSGASNTGSSSAGGSATRPSGSRFLGGSSTRYRATTNSAVSRKSTVVVGAAASRSQANQVSGLPFGVATGTQGGIDKLVALAIGVFVFLLIRRRPVVWIRKALGG
jgi:hypothetical protein